MPRQRISGIPCTRMRVLVKRHDLESVPTIVYAHEVPVLMQMHGEHNVTLLPDKGALGISDLTPRAEYERMESKYGENKETGVLRVQEAYGAYATGTFLRAMEAGREGVEAMMRSLQEDILDAERQAAYMQGHGEDEDDNDEDDGDDEGNAGDENVRAPETGDTPPEPTALPDGNFANKDEIMERMDMLGLPYNAQTSRAKLEEALAEHCGTQLEDAGVQVPANATAWQLSQLVIQLNA